MLPVLAPSRCAAPRLARAYTTPSASPAMDASVRTYLAQVGDRLGAKLVQDSGNELGDLLGLSLAVDGEGVGGKSGVDCNNQGRRVSFGSSIYTRSSTAAGRPASQRPSWAERCRAFRARRRRGLTFWCGEVHDVPVVLEHVDLLDAGHRLDVELLQGLRSGSTRGRAVSTRRGPRAGRAVRTRTHALELLVVALRSRSGLDYDLASRGALAACETSTGQLLPAQNGTRRDGSDTHRFGSPPAAWRGAPCRFLRMP